MRQLLSMWLLAALASTCAAQWENWDPSREGTGTDSLESNLSRTTTLPSDEDIFNALTQEPLSGRFFWTGRTGACRGEEDSIKGLAEFLATDINHTTMEVMLRKARVNMPSFASSPEARAKWQYAAQVYAQNAATTAYVLKGKCVRDGNVWDTIEFPALRAGGTNSSVDCVFEISSERALIVELLWQRQPDNVTACQRYLDETRAAIACNVYDRSWWSRGKGQQPGGVPNARYFQRLVGPTLFWWIGGAIEEPQMSLPWQYSYSLDASLTKPHFGDADSTCIRKMHATFENQTSKFPDAISLTDDCLTDKYDYWDLCPAHYRDMNRFGGHQFRIMPLGDSITYGYKSSDGNGYRAYVEANLAANNTVEFIGSMHSGSMANNNNEGHPGAEINAISSYADETLREMPNLVLLMAGTNDINNNDQVDTAPDRLAALIDKIISACPDAVVIVATIPAIANATDQARVDTYNAGIWSVAMRRSGEGKKVLITDMSNVNITDLADGLHPNDLGYKLMGQSWLDAIGKACFLGWVTAPQAASNGSSTESSTASTQQECPHLVNWIEQGEIANGAGLGTDLYEGYDCENFVGEDTACFCSKPGDYSFSPFLVNKGTVTNCDEFSYHYSHAVQFADLNGDGRDEYIWLHDDGAVTVFQNLGWTYINGQTGSVDWWPRGEIASGFGGQREQIHFADINGDGRADYLWVHNNGSVSMWLNVLSDPSDIKNITWVEQGIIAPSIGKTGAGVRFADLNGDKREEYLYVDLNGAITTYLNGGHTYINATTGSVVWTEQGLIATGVGATRDQIRLADINGDGRADYLVVGDDSSVQLWQNQGGPDNGSNAAKVGWWQRGTIATGVGDSGTHIVFGDLNGDGRAEYLDINNATSAIRAWLNGC